MCHSSQMEHLSVLIYLRGPLIDTSTLQIRKIRDGKSDRELGATIVYLRLLLHRLPLSIFPFLFLSLQHISCYLFGFS